VFIKALLICTDLWVSVHDIFISTDNINLQFNSYVIVKNNASFF